MEKNTNYIQFKDSDEKFLKKWETDVCLFVRIKLENHV